MRFFQDIRRIALLVTLAVLTGGLPACTSSDQGARRILENHLTAVGGREALEALHSRVAEGTFVLAGTGFEGTVSERMIFGTGSRSSIVIGGKEVAAFGVQNGIAWRFDPMSGAKILEGSQRDFALKGLAVDPVWAWRDRFDSATLAEEVPDDSRLRVNLTSPEGNQVLFLFEKETGLLAQTVFSLGESELTQSYSDYREVSGVKIAHRLRLKQGDQGTVDFIFSKMAFNVDLDPDTFTPPEQVRNKLGK